MLLAAFFVGSLAASLAGVAVFRRYGTASRILDVPNERSSHTVPTPLGAGVVIVAVCLSFYIIASASLGHRIVWSYVAGAAVVAAVSWLDDIYSLPAVVRFVVHGIAAAVLILASEPVSEIYFPGMGPVSLGWMGSVLTFLWIVWLTNAYNFMDGIDGIAGSQAVVAGAAWAAVGILIADPILFVFGGVIAGSSLGFLFHNWSPARVFMGDVGSAFLGFTFAAFPLLSSADNTIRPWLWVAAASFVWLFVFDTVFTFSRRLVKGEKVWQAHRQHVYQQLVINGWSHSSVTLLYSFAALFVCTLFIAALLNIGSDVPLLVLSYIASVGAVAIIAYRKKR